MQQPSVLLSLPHMQLIFPYVSLAQNPTDTPIMPFTLPFMWTCRSVAMKMSIVVTVAAMMTSIVAILTEHWAAWPDGNAGLFTYLVRREQAPDGAPILIYPCLAMTSLVILSCDFFINVCFLHRKFELALPALVVFSFISGMMMAVVAILWALPHSNAGREPSWSYGVACITVVLDLGTTGLCLIEFVKHRHHLIPRIPDPDRVPLARNSSNRDSPSASDSERLPLARNISDREMQSSSATETDPDNDITGCSRDRGTSSVSLRSPVSATGTQIVDIDTVTSDRDAQYNAYQAVSTNEHRSSDIEMQDICSETACSRTDTDNCDYNSKISNCDTNSTIINSDINSEHVTYKEPLGPRTTDCSKNNRNIQSSDITGNLCDDFITPPVPKSSVSSSSDRTKGDSDMATSIL